MKHAMFYVDVIQAFVLSTRKLDNQNAKMSYADYEKIMKKKKKKTKRN